MSTQTKAKRRKSSVIEEAGVHVRLFKRGRMFWLDVRHGDTRKRVSAETAERDVAEANARALAREIAKQLLLGVSPDTLTLGQVFAAYRQHKSATLDGQWKTAVETRQRLFTAAWGDAMTVAAISQTSVDAYCAMRRAAHLARQRAAHAAKVERERQRAAKRGVAFLPPVGLEIRPLRDGALDPDFRWLSSVFNWALRHKTPNGKRLLTFNPLHDCKWPREKNENVLRPIASQDRYTRTIAQAEAIDPAGRLRLALVLARYTARRIDAILHLRASDLLLSTDRVRAALASAGHDERLADTYTHGAIRWRAEHDKKGVERITPIAEAVRAEVDRYLAGMPRLGDVPLLPSVEDEARTLARTVATKWLAKAERRAELPKLRGGLWHAYRRLWATERKSLPDVDVAEAGGWTGTKAMKLAYQKHTPAGVLAAILNAQSA